jgi:hypothetical protein
MPNPPKFDAYDALCAGAKKAGAEIEKMGGIEQFRRPGEVVAPTESEPMPPPTLTAREYIECYGIDPEVSAQKHRT